MNKKLDLPLGTIGSVVAGILFAFIYNWLMGKYMIGYSLNSAIVSGGVFGALIDAPTTYLALKETGKVLVTTVLLAPLSATSSGPASWSALASFLPTRRSA